MSTEPLGMAVRGPALDPLLARLDAAFAEGAPDAALEREIRAMARIYDLEEADSDLAEVWATVRTLLLRRPSPRAHGAMSPLTALVVEDDPDLAAQLVDTLVDAGHRVVGPFATAEVAAVAAAQQPLDVAVLDINLAGPGTGVELARRLADSWGVPSVFLSGDVATAARHAGVAAAVVMKPCTADQVLDACVMAVQTGPARPAA